MKKLRTAISGLLCASLLFTTACGASDTNSGTTDVSTEKGRFVQKLITPEGAQGQYNSNLLKDSSGKLSFYSSDYTSKFESTDNGDTWKELAGPAEKNPQLKDSIYNLTSDLEGNIYGILQNNSEDATAPSNSFVKILDDGTVEPVNIPELTAVQNDSASGAYLQLAAILPNGKALISYTSGMSSVSADAEVVEEGAVTAAPTEEAASTTTQETSGTDAESTVPADDTDAADSSASLNTPMIMSGSNVNGIFDLATGKMEMDLSTTVPNWDTYSYASSKDSLVLFDYEGNGTKINLSDNSVAGNISIPSSENGYSSGAYSLADDNTLYSLNSTALYKINDSATEKIADSAAFAFGNPNSYVNNFYMIDDSNFIVCIQESSSVNIYKYTFDPEAKKDPNKVLTIWSLNDSYSIRSLISEFSQANPDATINYTPAIEGMSGNYVEADQIDTTAQDDAIKALNTELLSGKGPDIIVLDGLSASSYAEKGTLLDLSEKLDTSKVFKEVLDASKDGDKLYSIPTRFSMPLLVGAKDSFGDISTQEDLAKVIAAGPDAIAVDQDSSSDPFAAIPEDKRPIMKFEGFSELFDTMWTTSANAVIVDNKLQEDKLRTFLTDLKTISDKYKLAQPVADDMGSGSIMMSDSSGASYYGSSMAYMSGQAKYGALDYNNISSLEMFSMGGQNVAPSYINFPGLSEGVWKPTGLLAVNANTKNADFAVEFVSTAISLKAQSVLGNGLPVTQEAIDDQIKVVDDMYKKYPGEGVPTSFTFDFSTITSKIQTPYFYDAQTFSKVSTAAYDFCQGNTDLDSTVNKVKEDFRSYLAERE